MHSEHLTIETPSGVCTRALVTAILESRRAYQLAMMLAKQVLLAGPNMQVPGVDAEPVDGGHQPATPWTRDPAKVRPTDLRFSMRRRPARHGLRLVLPSHAESPLVMPAETPYTSAGEQTDEQADYRRQLDADQGRRSRDVGQADR